MASLLGYENDMIKIKYKKSNDDCQVSTDFMFIAKGN